MNKTNKEIIAEQLMALKGKITWSDREDAAQELGRSTNTVNNYLNNKVADEPTGLKLLAHLKNLISEREKALQE